MTDDQLFTEMAVLWVEHGGDVEGIEWCWRKILDAVRIELAARQLAELDAMRADSADTAAELTRLGQEMGDYDLPRD
jgi:hypothetical protein